ncbi:MAG TPA: CpsD/CapB family tyrosine-protein kinase [Edaphobacter sp.]|uniref:CpsD/CapB family tyrosine-protein kinase n=1 Tax=Edaphobacter sp. TaxID=1934404 RepID=UPI002C879072|nr:CpsD/CapB family tyrosine-protein kinase [Edaphobacter sp.]HUZ94431.1 CpsD/CapB family tyrosine-protein kinase [Edaphobacter sp.]
MSRIYEALQKAESERALDKRDREPRTPEQVAAPTPPSDFEPLAQTVVAEAEYEAPAPAAPVRPRYAAPAAATATNAPLDLSKIERRPWSPAFAQLPSLLHRGSAVEQFRSLRSRIFELRDVSPLKSILVSSGMPQEGKSFISVNLAFSLARHKNSKVLLIDGDMRRYTMHQILGCESQPGLADYLAGKAGIVEIMQRAEEMPPTDSSNQPAMPNLTFIAGGNGGDKAADLSGSPRFGDLIRQASPYFDWIIVDSSPVLPVSDAVNLARFCDGVLLVARGGVTKFPIAQRAQSELKAAKVLGFVLNAVHEPPQVGDYYGYDSTNE